MIYRNFALLFHLTIEQPFPRTIPLNFPEIFQCPSGFKCQSTGICQRLVVIPDAEAIDCELVLIFQQSMITLGSRPERITPTTGRLTRI